MLANPLSLSNSVETSAADAIRSALPFKDLPDQVIAALAEASSVRNYAAGETVFAMGQFDGSEFLIVRSGKVKAAHSDRNSGAMLIEELSSGAIFGLPSAVLGDEERQTAGVSLTAERDSEVVAVDSEILREIASQRPTVARNLMIYFAKRLLGGARAAGEELPERRVYAALAAYIERDAVAGDWRIPKMPKHRELADRADVEEAEAASAVAKLIQSGIARRNYPGLIIDDMAQLNRLSR